MNIILNRAADLLEQPNAWCQGSIAKDANGKPVGLAQEPRACSWCIIGAVVKAADGEHIPSDIFEKIRDAAQLRVITLGSWNDAAGRTQAEVVATLRKAAEA